MLISQFMSDLKSGVLENYGTLMTDDNKLLSTIYYMLVYIYSYRVRDFSIQRDELTTVNNSLTLSKYGQYIVDVKTADIEYKKLKMPFGLSDIDIEWKDKYFHSGKVITLSNTPSWTVTVRYIKVPEKITSSDLSNQLDLPDPFVGILYFLCMRSLYPYNLENWANLANNFKTSFVDDMFKVYERQHSIWVSVDSIKWSEIYN